MANPVDELLTSNWTHTDTGRISHLSVRARRWRWILADTVNKLLTGNGTDTDSAHSDLTVRARGRSSHASVARLCCPRRTNATYPVEDHSVRADANACIVASLAVRTRWGRRRPASNEVTVSIVVTAVARASSCVIALVLVAVARAIAIMHTVG